MFEEIAVVSLITAGRTGSGFLQSLFDDHPQIITVPVELKFHETWDRLGCFSFDSPRQMVDAWMRQSKLANMTRDPRWASYDFEGFRRRWTELLSTEGLSRPRVFLSLHQAYAESSGRSLADIKVILEFSSNPYFAGHFYEDFPQARFIQVVRDYRGNYASIKQKVINLSGGLFERRRLWIRHALLDVLDVLFERAEAAASLQTCVNAENWRMLRNDDLNLNNSETMTSLAEWLGLDVIDTLRDSTVNGIPWNGNSSFGESISGASMTAIDRWRSKLSKSEMRLIDYIFHDYQLAAGYQPENDVACDSLWRRLGAVLRPVSGEFSCNIKMMLKRGITRIAADIPILGNVFKFILGAVFIVTFVTSYPVVRIKLWNRVEAVRRRKIA